MKAQISIRNFINLKKEFSKINNLQTIDTTDQANGYPSNINGCYYSSTNFHRTCKEAKISLKNKIQNKSKFDPYYFADTETLKNK